MRVLLDESVPRRLGFDLAPHFVFLDDFPSVTRTQAVWALEKSKQMLLTAN